jgi:Alkaline phosphatase
LAFNVPEPALERWNFSYYEDLFAQDANAPTIVRVTSKAYRRVALYEPGDYVATLTYYNGSTTVANWLVRPLATQKKAKNVILFIGDGMTTNMITAARLIGHKSINGRYQSKMELDKFPVLGHQMVSVLNALFESMLDTDLSRLTPSTASLPTPPIVLPLCTLVTRAQSMLWEFTPILQQTHSMIRRLRPLLSS